MCANHVVESSYATPLMPLEAKVALLGNPEVYPETTRVVSKVETHMSCVFLTDSYAYKLKKPVHYSYLDFSTLAARERFCREELRLNQRLAPGVYLDVVPLTVDALHEARLGGKGAIVEWLIKMRRLPADRMLPSLISRRTLSAADIEPLARLLVAFYREGRPVIISADDYRSRYRRAIMENRDVLCSGHYGIPETLAAAVHDTLLATLERHSEMFDRRAIGGWIVEGHGDLRPEHICLETPPIVFDRLEFNRQFRLLDAVDELGFLAMECERLGASFVGDVLFSAYTQATGDVPPLALRRFYMAHRACIRARLAVLHTPELEQHAWGKWLQAAAEYLRMAERYCRETN